MGASFSTAGSFVSHYHSYNCTCRRHWCSILSFFSEIWGTHIKLLIMSESQRASFNTHGAKILQIMHDNRPVN